MIKPFWIKKSLSILTSKIGDGIHGTPIYVETGGFPFINGNNLKLGAIVITEDTKRVAQAEFEKYFIEFDEHTIFMFINGTLGSLAKYNGEQIILGKSAAYIKCENINSVYLYYYLHLKEVQNHIWNIATGSTIKNLSLASIRGLEVSVPCLNTQTKIAKVLAVIDSKIELNNRINTELEAMAKTLYDYWFVQFDFPDANSKPYKTSGGKMVYNKALKREIPEGWLVELLSQWIVNDKTGDWGKDQLEGNYTLKVNCIRGADINGLIGQGLLQAPTRYILKKNKSKLLSPFDFIIEISGGSPTQSTGRMACITNESLNRFSNPLICSNFCKVISLKDERYFFNFAYLWDSIYSAGILFGWEGKTSGIKNLLFDAFVNKHFICTPPVNLVSKYYEFVSPLNSEKQKNLKQNSELVSLRDWLLPMLMNGQVTVVNKDDI